MSLILDALRKADQDRKIDNDSPELGDIYTEQSSSSKPSRLIMLCIAAFTVLVCILLIVFIANLVGDDNTKTNNPPHVSQETTSSSNNTQPDTENNKVEKNNIDSAKPQSNTSISAKALKTQIVKAQYESLQKNIKTADKETLKNTKDVNSEDRVSALYSNEDSSTERETISKLSKKSVNSSHLNPTDSDKKNVATGQPKTQDKISEDMLEAYSDIPLIKELPLSMQRDIPTLMYAQHISNSRPRRVVINGKTLSEGKTVTAGIRIKKILSNGLLLEKTNTTFKMAARSSWINF